MPELLCKKLSKISTLMISFLVLASSLFFYFYNPQPAYAGISECLAGGGAAAAAAAPVAAGVTAANAVSTASVAAAATAAAAPSGLPVKAVSTDAILLAQAKIQAAQLAVDSSGVTVEAGSLAVGAGSFAKECFLDGIAVTLRETLIRKITDATVRWINSGFEGSPAFVENVGNFLTDTADEAFGEFIYNDENFGFLCSPFQINVRFALALGYASQVRRPVCTLSEVADNVEGAIDDLSDQWSWDTFDVITTGANGNYFSSYVTASEDLARVIETTTGQKIDDLNRSGGFLSYEECSPRNQPAEYGNNSNGITTNGNETVIGGDERSRRFTNDAGEECIIKTPGSVINEQLNYTLSSDIRRLELADELDEVFSALMGQLVKQVLGGGGISGLSRSNAGSQSFLDLYVQDAEQSANRSQNDVGSVITAYETNAEQSILTNQEKIRLLLEAKTTVNSAFTCYESKYNTWVTADGEIIDPSQLSTIPESERTRAVFVQTGGTTTESGEPVLLTPEISFEKFNQLQRVLENIDDELENASDAIDQARTGLEDVTEYQARLNGSSGIVETQQIYQSFSDAIAGSGISTSIAAGPTETTQTQIDDILNGVITSFDPETGEPIRSGGSIAELAYCQSFINVVN